MPWTLDKNGVTPDVDLTTAEQDKLNAFMGAIQNDGKHPRTAAQEAGDTMYENLQGDQYQIRLSKANRATFTVDDDNERVTFLQVGGHT